MASLDELLRRLQSKMAEIRTDETGCTLENRTNEKVEKVCSKKS